MSEMRQLDLIISDKVQGVGFRFFIVKLANDLNIKGFVRNNSDGSVSMCAIASQDILEKFLSKIENSSFQIDEIKSQYSKPQKDYFSFSIVYP